jgi:hypothetical protein
VHRDFLFDFAGLSLATISISFSTKGGLPPKPVLAVISVTYECVRKAKNTTAAFLSMILQNFALRSLALAGSGRLAVSTEADSVGLSRLGQPIGQNTYSILKDQIKTTFGAPVDASSAVWSRLSGLCSLLFGLCSLLFASDYLDVFGFVQNARTDAVVSSPGDAGLT